MGEPLARYQGLSLGDPVMIGVTVTRGDSDFALAQAKSGWHF